MSRAQEIISEIFGTPGMSPSRIKHDSSVYHTKEKIGGREFEFGATNLMGTLVITFTTKVRPGESTDAWTTLQTPLDNPRDAFKVISTAISFVKTAVMIAQKKGEDIEEIQFTAHPAETSRMKLYARITSMIKKSFPGSKEDVRKGTGAWIYSVYLP